MARGARRRALVDEYFWSMEGTEADEVRFEEREVYPEDCVPCVVQNFKKFRSLDVTVCSCPFCKKLYQECAFARALWKCRSIHKPTAERKPYRHYFSNGYSICQCDDKLHYNCYCESCFRSREVCLVDNWYGRFLCSCENCEREYLMCDCPRCDQLHSQIPEGYRPTDPKSVMGRISEKQQYDDFKKEEMRRLQRNYIALSRKTTDSNCLPLLVLRILMEQQETDCRAFLNEYNAFILAYRNRVKELIRLKVPGYHIDIDDIEFN